MQCPSFQLSHLCSCHLAWHSIAVCWRVALYSLDLHLKQSCNCCTRCSPMICGAYSSAWYHCINEHLLSLKYDGHLLSLKYDGHASRRDYRLSTLREYYTCAGGARKGCGVTALCSVFMCMCSFAQLSECVMCQRGCYCSVTLLG